MESNTIFDKLGGRKFVMSIVAMLIAAAIDAFGKNGLTTNMAGLITALYTAFAATNAFVSGKVAANMPEGEQQPVAPANPQTEQTLQALVPILNQVGQELAAIKEAQAQSTANLNTMQKAVITLMQRG